MGARLMEQASLPRTCAYTPLLRSPRSLARLAKLGLAPRFFDGQDPGSLAAALKGSEAVVNLAVGEPGSIEKDVENVYNACVKAGVRLLIHMSSAVVFGRVLSPNIHDDSEPDVNSWMLYARQKARAEVFLRKRLEAGGPQVVVLRPGLIWGPKSPWSVLPARQIADGIAWVGGSGTGVCNLLHVDNLVTCIRRVLGAKGSLRGFYNVADHDLVDWNTFYCAIAEGLGYPKSRVRLTNAGYAIATPGAILQRLRESDGSRQIVSYLLKTLSPGTKEVLKRLVPGLGQQSIKLPEPADSTMLASSPVLRRDIWVLHNTRNKLLTSKFFRDFGEPGLMTFNEGLVGTIAWLRFAGYGAESMREQT